jgi:hypothetical protein
MACSPVLPGSTRASVVFFSNFGAAYTARVDDVPASTGYGEPVQKLFKLRDGERIIAAFSLDPRVTGKIETKKEGVAPPIHAIAVTSDGYSLRFSSRRSFEPSTRAGRRYARPSGRCRSRWRGEDRRIRDCHRCHARRAGDPVPCGRGELSLRAGQGRHFDQAAVEGRSCARVHSPPPAIAT